MFERIIKDNSNCFNQPKYKIKRLLQLCANHPPSSGYFYPHTVLSVLRYQASLYQVTEAFKPEQGKVTATAGFITVTDDLYCITVIDDLYCLLVGSAYFLHLQMELFPREPIIKGQQKSRFY